MRHSGISLDYRKYKLKKEVSLFEDGLRTSGKKGEYEWWYFDSKLEDGSSLVIVFFLKPMTSFKKGFQPYVTFDLTFPDGTTIHEECYPNNENDYSFSNKSLCPQKGDLSN